MTDPVTKGATVLELIIIALLISTLVNAIMARYYARRTRLEVAALRNALFPPVPTPRPPAE